MLIRCNELPRPIAFQNCDDVVDLLRRATRGWTLEPWPFRSTVTPCVTVHRTRGEYHVYADGRDDVRIEPSAVSALCTLVVDINGEALAAQSDACCLHAAAARISGTLVVFPSTHRAGKSLLMACLAAGGHEVFADDIVPLRADGNRVLAQAPGVLPRLRLPLPATLPADIATFAETNAGPGDGYYRYLDLAPVTFAPRGTTTPIGEFVFLDRKTGRHRTPRLTVRERGRALQDLLRQGFGSGQPATGMLTAFAGLVAATPCHTLSYSDPGDALDLLASAFDQPRPVSEHDVVREPAPIFRCNALGDQLPAPGTHQPETSERFRPVDRGRRTRLLQTTLLRRAPTVQARPIEGRLFLCDDRAGKIFGLDGIAPIVWELIDEPAPLADILRLLTDAYPDIASQRIERDVRMLLSRLLKAGLVQTVALSQAVPARPASAKSRNRLFIA